MGTYTFLIMPELARMDFSAALVKTSCQNVYREGSVFVSIESSEYDGQYDHGKQRLQH